MRRRRAYRSARGRAECHLAWVAWSGKQPVPRAAQCGLDGVQGLRQSLLFVSRAKTLYSISNLV